MIDRDSREVTVYSEPVEGVYQERHTVVFGKNVSLPEPIGIDLDTEPLLDWTSPVKN